MLKLTACFVLLGGTTILFTSRGTDATPGFETRSLDSAQFKAVHASVMPGGDGERWTEIPWMTDLLEARKAAARQGKPLFMWIMDGHPLGCT